MLVCLDNKILYFLSLILLLLKKQNVPSDDYLDHANSDHFLIDLLFECSEGTGSKLLDKFSCSFTFLAFLCYLLLSNRNTFMKGSTLFSL